MLTLSNIPTPANPHMAAAGELFAMIHSAGVTIALRAEAGVNATFVVLADSSGLLRDHVTAYVDADGFRGATCVSIPSAEIEAVSDEPGKYAWPAATPITCGELVIDATGAPYVAVAHDRQGFPMAFVHLQNGKDGRPTRPLAIYHRWKVVVRGRRKEDDQVIAEITASSK